MMNFVFTLTVAFAIFRLNEAGTRGGICQEGNVFKMGCFNMAGGEQRPLNETIYNGRHDIDWKNYRVSINIILCRCRAKAMKQGYTAIGIQFYGVCYGTRLPMLDLDAALSRSEDCTNEHYKKCDDSQKMQLCAGKEFTTAVYQLKSGTDFTWEKRPINGGFGQWTAWTPCSSSCGVGEQVRERLCDNPKPSSGGKECSGEREEWRECSIKHCESTPQHISFHCGKLDNKQEVSNLQSSSTFNMNEPHCMAPAKEEAKNPQRYKVSVSMLSVTESSAILGVYFNAEDSDNYNFAYINILSNQHCYQTGRVIKGRSYHDQNESKCQKFPAKEWIDIVLEVKGKTAQLYANKRFLGKWLTMSTNTGKAGVLIRNGFPSEVFKAEFKKLEIE